MVLRLCAALVLLGGCIHRAPPARLSEPARIATAIVLDGPGAIPPEIPARLDEALSARNLSLQTGDVQAASRNTQQRLAALARTSDAPYALLIEARVRYYDQLQGQFRWVVDARVTVARREDLSGAAISELELPVFLLYEHERETEALKAAAGALAEKTGRILDDFLSPTRTAAMYFVLVDRFTGHGGDPQDFHGGTISGVLQHLDDLQSLGVRTVWLSPVFKMRTEKFYGYGAFHGYWTEDLSSVEPRFGTLEDLQRLSAELHRRGMQLYLDLVLNHVGPDAPLAREKPGWFHHNGPVKDWSDRAQLENDDVMGLPDLAQENPEVEKYLIDAAESWVARVHPDGFRLDAVKHVPLSFWTKFNAALHARGVALLGEALEGDAVKLAPVQRAGGFDSLFDFPLGFALTDVFCKDKPVGRIGATLSLDRLYANADALVTLLDDHDLPRVTSLCGGDLARVEQALLVQLLMRGTPLITYGTESALTGEHEPDNRGDMQWSQQPLRGAIQHALAMRAQYGAVDHVAALDADLLILAGERVTIAINRGSQPRQLALGTVPARGSLVVPQGAPRPSGSREVIFEGSGALSGAGPELGDWDTAHAVALPAHLVLPVGAVAEFKLIQRKPDGTVEWERGEDRFVLVQPGDGAQRVGGLEWRG